MIGLAWSIDMLWPLIIVIPFWRLVIRPAFVSMYRDVLFSSFHNLYLALFMWRLGSFRPDRSVRSFPGIPISLSFLISHSISIAVLTLAPTLGSGHIFLPLPIVPFHHSFAVFFYYYTSIPSSASAFTLPLSRISFIFTFWQVLLWFSVFI